MKFESQKRIILDVRGFLPQILREAEGLDGNFGGFCLFVRVSRRKSEGDIRCDYLSITYLVDKKDDDDEDVYEKVSRSKSKGDIGWDHLQC